jgi:hypothetical protein
MVRIFFKAFHGEFHPKYINSKRNRIKIHVIKFNFAYCLLFK